MFCRESHSYRFSIVFYASPYHAILSTPPLPFSAHFLRARMAVFAASEGLSLRTKLLSHLPLPVRMVPTGLCYGHKSHQGPASDLGQMVHPHRRCPVPLHHHWFLCSP